MESLNCAAEFRMWMVERTSFLCSREAISVVLRGIISRSLALCWVNRSRNDIQTAEIREEWGNRFARITSTNSTKELWSISILWNINVWSETSNVAKFCRRNRRKLGTVPLMVDETETDRNAAKMIQKSILYTLRNVSVSKYNSKLRLIYVGHVVMWKTCTSIHQ